MKTILNIAIFALTLFLIDSAIAQDNKEEWYRSRWETINSAKQEMDPKWISKLGTIVYGLSLSKDELKPESLELYEAARSTLMQIPGHAEYYGNEIKRITDEQIAKTFRGHSSERGWDYKTLEQLPSPETVKVLGELLFDERDPWKKLGVQEGGQPYANSTHAVMTLNNLGIKNAPVKKIAFDEPDVHTWQLWFEQVKAGTKTFSFNGDPQEYTLKGSVIGKVTPTESRSSRNAPSSAQAPEEKKKANLPWFALTAAALLVAVGAWLVRRNRISQKA